MQRKTAVAIRIFLYTSGFFLLLALIRYVEHSDSESSINSLFDAFWFSVVTLTTVGYGDAYPVTLPGKIFGLILILFSLGVLSYVIGQITSRIQKYMEKKKMGHYGTDFSNHVIVAGWDNFGKSIIDQVVGANQNVAVITNKKDDIDIIDELYSNYNKKHKKVFVIFGELSDPDILQKANIDQASSLFINIEDDSRGLVYLINLRKTYKDINVVTYLSNPELKETFYNAGATYVIPEKEITSRLIASFVFEPDVARYTEDLITTATSGDTYDFMEFRVLPENPYVGQNCQEAFFNLKKDLNAILMGISKKRDRDSFDLVKNPGTDTTVAAGDFLILVSDGTSKKSLEKAFAINEGRVITSSQ